MVGRVAVGVAVVMAGVVDGVVVLVVVVGRRVVVVAVSGRAVRAIVFVFDRRSFCVGFIRKHATAT